LPEISLQRLGELTLVRQLALLVGLAAVVAVGVSVFVWSQKPGMVPLYSDLDAADAGEVRDALTSAGIKHRLSGSGGVLVPGGELHAARLKLAERGLPNSAGVGFEMIREEQGFGVSQFIENARYQRALETELVRTISEMRPVRRARVHLAIPKRSAFAREHKPASASVLLELYSGRSLQPHQIAAIANLVASSVPEMESSQVTVVDQQGRLLNEPGDDSEMAMNAGQFEYLRRVEQSYVDRIETLLRPITGPGRVSAQVAVDMDFTSSEATREAYEPDREAIRSEQVVEDRSGEAGEAGVPGAASNKPDGEAPAKATAEAAESESVRRESTRNYELDRTIEHNREPPGRIQRMSVAVLVDHIPKPNDQGEIVPAGLNDAQLAEIERLVRDAVGFDAARGDTVSVVNAPFYQAPMDDAAPSAPMWDQPAMHDWARQIFGVVVVLVLLLAVLRPMLRQLLSQPSWHDMRDVTPRDDEVGEDQLSLSGAGGSTAALGAGGGGYEQKLMLAREAVNQDAKRVAQVVKKWVNDDG